MADHMFAVIQFSTPFNDTRTEAGIDRLDDDLAFLHFLEYSVRAALSATYPAGRRAKSETPRCKALSNFS